MMKDGLIELDYKCTWNSDMYLCEITDDINEYMNITENLSEAAQALRCPVRQIGYYIMSDKPKGIESTSLAIRRPGSTVGYMTCNKDNVITKICIDYLKEPELSNKLQKYVGCKIQYPNYSIFEFKNRIRKELEKNESKRLSREGNEN